MAKQNKYTEAAKKAQEQTDEEYKFLIAGLTRLTFTEINTLFPERSDKDRLVELLALVNSATSENNKIIKLKENSEKFGGVVIRLIKALV